MIIIVVGTVCLNWSRAELRSKKLTHSWNQEAAPPLYLPSVRHVKLVTLGFDHFFGDILWFSTINYFGKHFEQDKDYRWLGHMCELVTSLDPKARHVYEFCATMLSWVSWEAEKSTALLSKAIKAEPSYWRYWYLRGFNYWYFLNRRDLAEKDLTVAATLPGAPPFLASLASRLMVSKDEVTAAISFLKDLIANTQDENARKALEEKLKEAYISRDIRILRGMIAQYENDYGRKATSLKQLVEAKMLKAMPLDPFGAPYFIDQQSGAIKTRSGKKGLEFFGKTSDTGVARHLKPAG